MSYIVPGVVDRVLAALAEQLEALGSGRTHLVVIGGSALVALGLAHRATRDVDVVALRDENRLVTARPLPARVLEAAAIVASDFGLDEGRLNPGPTSLLEIGGLPAGFLDRVRTIDYGPALTISFAGRTDQIHFKLYALADRSEPRDESDLRGLEPTPDELKSAAAWARTHNAPGPFDDRLRNVLKDLGVRDVGRTA